MSYRILSFALLVACKSGAETGDSDTPDDTDCTTTTWYADADADGFGDAATAVLACAAPAGAVTDATDCDDTSPAISPDGVEICDGVDQDCDGAIDDTPTDAGTFHADADGDGYGDPTATTMACAAPSGFVDEATDCDDADAAVHPRAAELLCDGIDQDCDGADSDDAVIDASGTIPASFPTFAAALDAASPGDAICVADGTYRENVVIDVTVHIGSYGGAANAILQSAVVDSPVVRVNADDVTIDGLTVSGGDITASQAPGAAVYVTGDRVGLYHLDVTDNATSFGGGAIDVVANDATVADCTIHDNDTSGVYLHGSSSQPLTGIVLRDDDLHDNDAIFGGGVQADHVDGLVVEGLTLTSNAAGYYGGGIYLDDCSGASLDHDTYVDNRTTSASGDNGGGGLFVECSQGNLPVSISGETFTHNTTGAWGGALSLKVCPGAHIDQAVFQNNRATDKGGAISLNFCDHATISGGEFEDDHANGNGGALYARGGEALLVTGSTFTGDDAGVYGGALALSNSAQAHVTSCTFDSTTADHGGAIYTWDDSSIATDSGTDDVVDQCTFTGCTATEEGGAVLFSTKRATLSNSTIVDGQATTGAGLAFVGAAQGVADTNTFTNDQASLEGGALSCAGTRQASSFTETSSTFGGNTPDDIYCATGCTSLSCP
jgi:hypothetical protein